MRPALLLTMMMATFGFAWSEEQLEQGENTGYDRSKMFEADSEFIKGFETGILARSKGGNMEDFGCKVSDEKAQEKIKVVLETISAGINSASAMTQNMGSNFIKNALTMLTEFLTAASQLITALNPETDLDLYCRGMVFGLHGSGLLVKFANIVLKSRKKVFKPATPAQVAKGQKGKVGYEDPIAAGMKNIGEYLQDRLQEGNEEKEADL